MADSYTLDNIELNRRNIFADSNRRISARAINRLHAVTRERVVQREIWFQPGDEVSIADARELERLIRELDLFARVDVVLRPDLAQPGRADLIINTEDRLSIIASAGGSFLGGVGEVEFSVGDKNLFGLGHQLVFGYSRDTDGGLRGSLAYDNVLVSGSDVYAGGQLGQTEEGDFAEVTVENRLQNSEDSTSWSVELDYQTTRIDFFDQGESVAEVPRARNRLRADFLWRTPIVRTLTDTEDLAVFSSSWRYGPVVNVTDLTFESAIGSAASSIDVPEDNLSVFLGGRLARDGATRYRKLTFLDTLSYEQDVVLGNSLEVLLGAKQFFAESGDSLRPALFVSGWSNHAPTEHSFLNVGFDAAATPDGNELDDWSVTAAITGYYTGLRTGTVASRLLYRSAASSTGLAPQQTLGESNGLRGYPANEFNGEQKLVLNLEHRFPTLVRVATLELAGLLFFDSGWVGDRGNSAWLDETRAAWGGGIRIGSSPLLGSGIIRLDVAFPLDDDPIRDYGPTLSLAVGQVFGFRP